MTADSPLTLKKLFAYIAVDVEPVAAIIANETA
jgi:hypothetical protein